MGIIKRAFRWIVIPIEIQILEDRFRKGFTDQVNEMGEQGFSPEEIIDSFDTFGLETSIAIASLYKERNDLFPSKRKTEDSTYSIDI